VPRLILTIVVAGVTLITFLCLRACFQAVVPPKEASPTSDVGDSVVAISDGSVMVAKPGTISRDVIDWFNDGRAPPRSFDIGWQPFEPNSAQPVADSQIRLGRFAVEMRANRDINAKIFVCTTKTDSGATELAKRRATRLTQLLVAEHVPADRISAATCSLNDARRVAAFRSNQDGEVIEIALSR
jgi:hypothetical protein